MIEDRRGKGVLFEPVGAFAPFKAGETIVDLALAAGLQIRADCGGQGVCGQCRVTVEPPSAADDPTEAEIELLGDETAAGQRLACQARLREPATITLSDRVLESGQALGKVGFGGQFDSRPLVRREVIPAVDRTEQEGQTDRAAWLAARLAEQGRAPLGELTPAAVADLAELNPPEQELTAIGHAEQGLTAVLPGRRERSLGLAVDIGTTTLAGYLADLTTGQVIASHGLANPQRRWGEDVISRIAHVSQNDDGLAALRSAVVGAVNELAGLCLEKVGAEPADLDEATIVGNPTMIHLFSGYQVRSLGVFPYLPTVSRLPDRTAAELGLNFHPAMNVHVLPLVSGFVGADTVGAVLAARPHLADEMTLIVDIGTNGELVLGNRDRLWATSCATGPALEGAHISSGMRASRGAIHQVELNRAADGPVCRVLGEDNETPVGLCGSGVIDLIAVLRRLGTIKPTGRLTEGAPGVETDDKGIGRRYLIPGGDDGLALALGDIRQVQLAKAALMVGIEFLMEAAGIDKIDRLVLTGAFGARFNWRSGVEIGLLPPAAVAGRVETMSNGAGLGAIMALVSADHRAEALDLAGRIESLELSARPDFNDAFTARLGFPEPFQSFSEA